MIGNPGASGYERDEFDWYVEDRRAVLDLLDREAFAGTVHDPACGAGNIPKCFIERGIVCTGADIVDRGYGATFDFLTSDLSHGNIVTNPPFKIATEFTLHALRHSAGKVAVLQQLTWLEGKKRGEALFARNQLARVWVFRRRISLPPGDSEVKATGGKKAFAWFVFDVRHQGTWTGGWIQ